MAGGDSEAACGVVVIDQHLGPEEMAALFSHTALNFHPCTYDAYGMSVVEAAAFGAPSIVNGGGTIGATALLGADGCFQVDLDGHSTGAALTGAAPELAATILAALDDAETMGRVAAAARERALGWGEEAAGRQLHEAIVQAIGGVEIQPGEPAAAYSPGKYSSSPVFRHADEDLADVDP